MSNEEEKPLKTWKEILDFLELSNYRAARRHLMALQIYKHDGEHPILYKSVYISVTQSSDHKRP